MAIVWEIPGVDFVENLVGFAPPVTDGLQAWFHVEKDAETAAWNLAPDASPGSIVGSPTYHDGYVRLGGGAYIETGIPQSGDCHMMVGIRVPDGTVFGSNFCFGVSSHVVTPSSPYLALKSAAGAAPFPAASPYAGGSFMVSGTPTFAQAIAPNVADCRDWMFLTMMVKGGEGIRIRNLTAGTEFFTANANAVYDGPNTWRIGASSGANGLPVDICFMAGFNAKKSDAEELAVYASPKERKAYLHAITL